MSKPRIEGPDILRGLAASAIVVYHVLYLSGLVVPESISAVVSKFGSGVPLFFAISAFSLSYNYSDDSFFSKNNLKNFFLKRFFRIVPLFWLIFLAEFLITKFAYHGDLATKMQYFFSAFFMFPFVPTYEPSAVWGGWSLGIEMVFYLLFPVIMLFFRRKTSALAGWVVFMIASIYMVKVKSNAISEIKTSYYFNFLYHMVFFMSGILVFNFLPLINRLKEKLGSNAVMFSGVFLPLTVLVSVFYFRHIDIWFKYNHIFYSLCWITILSISIINLPKVINNRFTRFLGLASYSIYLLHPLLLVILREAGYFKFLAMTYNQLNAYLLGSVTLLVLTYIFAFFTYNYIEKPFMRLGKKFLLASDFVKSAVCLPQENKVNVNEKTI